MPNLTIDHASWLAGQLKDDEFAAHYIAAAARDLEPAVFTAALQHMLNASGNHLVWDCQ
jgi:hypothetical protein